MQMRLIDEDVLAGESVKILTWLIERQGQGISTTLGELHQKWIDAVRKAPTAYDLDKVVEQLEEVEKIMTSPVNEDCFGEECRASDCTVCLISKAIEIVKGGGVDG